MTLTEFRSLAAAAFGDYRAEHIVSSHHLSAFGGRTAADALDSGASVKRVWLALCDDFDVSDQHRDPER